MTDLQIYPCRACGRSGRLPAVKAPRLTPDEMRERYGYEACVKRLQST